MSNKRVGFELKSWYEQMMKEKTRLESELNRVTKVLETLNSFVTEENVDKPRTQGLLSGVMDGEFKQLTTLNKKIRLLYFLLDIIRIFSTETDKDNILSLAVEKATQLLDADRAILFLIDLETDELYPKMPTQKQGSPLRFPANTGLVGYVAETGKTINVADITKDSRFNPEIDEKPVYQAKNLMLTPLYDEEGEVMGVLEVLNKNEGKFTDDDEHLLQAFIAQVAMSLENNKLPKDSSLSVTNTMLAIMKALSGGLDPDSLLQSLTKKTTQVMKADRSTIFLIDFAQQEIWSKVAEGSGINEIRFPLNTGIAGHCAFTGETLNITDAYKDPRFNTSIDAKTGYHTNTILATPLRDDTDKVIGVMQVLNKKVGNFTEQDEKLICAFAAEASKVLKSAQFLVNLISIIDMSTAATEEEIFTP